VLSDEVLASRDQVIAEGLSILIQDKMKILSDIAQPVARNRLKISISHTASAACGATRVA
jgi:hypothetical protein